LTSAKFITILYDSIKINFFQALRKNKGAVKKVPKKKGCDLAKKQDSSLFLWYN